MNYRTKLKALVLTIVLALTLNGCSLVSITKKHYKNEKPEIPREKLLSFDSKEALASGATLNNQLAAKAFYEGLLAKSKEAKALYDLSYRFLGFLGVNSTIDPEDPLAVEEAIKKFDAANLEKDRINHDLKEQIVKQQIAAEQDKDKIVRDKKKEFEENNNKWVAKMGSIFWWTIFFVILAVIILFGGAAYIQFTTGVPILSGLITGSLKTMGKGFHQVVAGCQNFRDHYKEILKSETATEEQKLIASEALAKLSSMMNNVQDESVRDFITKVKESPRVVKNLFSKKV